MEENNKCCCGQKKKERSPEEFKKLIHRLNRIEGQIRGIRGMVENDAYCPDILMQSAAVNAALNAFNRELLGEPYPHPACANDIRAGQGRGDRRAGGDDAEADEISIGNTEGG